MTEPRSSDTGRPEPDDVTSSHGELVAEPRGLDELVAEFIAQMRCYKCGEPTDRYIRFVTPAGIVDDYECLACRAARVQRQIDLGLRPASDLDRLPEDRHRF